MPTTYAIPTPEFHLGQRVHKATISPWLRGLYVREMLRHARQVITRLWNSGYCLPRTARLPKHTKDTIRRCLNVIDQAHTVEIVGVAPLYGHVSPHFVYNECYITRGQCHSGITFGYTLLFRADIPKVAQFPSPELDINCERKPGAVNTVCVLSPCACILSKNDVYDESTS